MSGRIAWDGAWRPWTLPNDRIVERCGSIDGARVRVCVVIGGGGSTDRGRVTCEVDALVTSPEGDSVKVHAVACSPRPRLRGTADFDAMIEGLIEAVVEKKMAEDFPAGDS